MDAMKSWFLSVMGVVGLVLALHHLGMDVSASLGSTLRSIEQFVNQPLL
jgi:hypothetical protein